MNRGDDVLVGRIAAIIIDEIVSSDWREIAKRLNVASGVGEAMDAGSCPDPTDECARL